MTVAAAVAALVAGVANTQERKTYCCVVDQNANIVIGANSGLCWHTSKWTPCRSQNHRQHKRAAGFTSEKLTCAEGCGYRV